MIQLPMLPGAVPVVRMGFICPMTIRIAYSKMTSTYFAGISERYFSETPR